MFFVFKVLTFLILLKNCASHCDVEKILSFEIPEDFPECLTNFELFKNGLKNEVSWALDSELKNELQFDDVF